GLELDVDGGRGAAVVGDGEDAGLAAGKALHTKGAGDVAAVFAVGRQGAHLVAAQVSQVSDNDDAGVGDGGAFVLDHAVEASGAVDDNVAQEYGALDGAVTGGGGADGDKT